MNNTKDFSLYEQLDGLQKYFKENLLNEEEYIAQKAEILKIHLQQIENSNSSKTISPIETSTPLMEENDPNFYANTLLFIKKKFKLAKKTNFIDNSHQEETFIGI